MPVIVTVRDGKPVPRGSVPITRHSRHSEAEVLKAFHAHAGENPSKRTAVTLAVGMAFAVAVMGGLALWSGYGAPASPPQTHTLK